MCLKSEYTLDLMSSTLHGQPVPGPTPPQLPHYLPLTCLEAGLQHIWRDCHSPVEDPCDAPSHQDPRHAELSDTAEYQPPSDKGCDSGFQTIPPVADRAVTEKEKWAGGRRPKARTPVTQQQPFLGGGFTHLLHMLAPLDEV